MLMRGDLQKIFDQVNPVFETAFARITQLEEEVKELKEAAAAPKAAPKEAPKAKKEAA